uniref:Microtubule-associated protein 7a n=1 Tax=Poecilia latipinna TaxID=48699 RepID=A0A3B3UTR9_9TELE
FRGRGGGQKGGRGSGGDMRESSAMPGSIPSMAVQKKQSVVPSSQGPLSTSTIDTGNGLNVDERLKAARERREEQQKLLVSRELSRLEREQRARRYYEQQLQERRKKLLEQRLKEERRRAAVEEKRKQRLREEKERHETAVRRTIERSQKAQQQLSQSPRGRKLVKNGSWNVLSVAFALLTNFTLINAPAPRRLPLSTWERNLVSRLLTPTCSYLARSKSAACSGSSVNVSGSIQIQKVRQEAMKKTPNSGSAKRSSAAAVNVEEIFISENDCFVLSLCPYKASPLSDPQPAEVMLRPSAGTTDPKEALRLLAEKRREARMQREKEEQERLQREEQARQEAEARRLVEEKRRREEEEQRRAEEERQVPSKHIILLSQEKSSLYSRHRFHLFIRVRMLFAQREEELAKERARAEQMKQEREIAAQKEEAERQARKKRLEEIMRRTRRTDSPDTVRFTDRLFYLFFLINSTQPRASYDTHLTSTHEKAFPSPALTKSENTQPPHNGTIEDAAKTLVGTKTAAQLGLGNEDDVVPVVAFKERRSLRALSGLEDIQTKQRAEVI